MYRFERARPTRVGVPRLMNFHVFDAHFPVFDRDLWYTESIKETMMGYYKNLVIEEQERELQAAREARAMNRAWEEEILQGNCTQDEEDEYAALLYASYRMRDNDEDLDDVVEDLMEETCDAEAINAALLNS